MRKLRLPARVMRIMEARKNIFFAAALGLCALAATASLGPAQAQQSQHLDRAGTWCYASEADGVSPDLKIGGCSTVILSGTLSNSYLALAYSNRGFAYGTKGQHDDAIQDYDQAIELDPSNAIVYNNRGIAYSDKGQLDRAIEDYDQAIKLNPSDAIFYNNRGFAYSNKGQLDHAIQDYDQAIKLDPSDAIVYYNRGIAYSAKGQLDRAIQDYDQAIKLDPSDADFFYERGLVRAKKGDKKGANADLAAARRTGIPAHRRVRFRTLAALKAADEKWLKLAKAVKLMRAEPFTVSSPYEIGTRAVKRGDVIVRAGSIDSADEPRTITVIYKSKKVFERKTIAAATAQILRDGSVFLAVSGGGNAGNYEGFYIRRGSGGKWSETEFGLCCGGQLLSELMGNGKLYLRQDGEMLDCCNLSLGHARATYSVIVYELRGKRLVEVTEPKVIRRAVAPALAQWYRSIEEYGEALTQPSRA